MSKRNVTCVKPPEPSFLRKLKEQVGYKAGPTIDTKKQRLPASTDPDDENNVEKDDEKPVVVVLKSGDLSEEEANRYQKESLESVKDDKIKFVKPQKRKGEDTSKRNRKQTKNDKNTVLLSFDVEENDD